MKFFSFSYVDGTHKEGSAALMGWRGFFFA